jgi:NO-binding membrane sensor protein with MHYT domain
MHDTHQSYSLLLVAMSYVISVLGSFTALQLAISIPGAQTTRQRWAAVLVAGAAMGIGAIWAMHFIAMLACDTGMEVAYDMPLTALSALIAFAACSIGLGVAGAGVFTWSKLVSGGIYMGLGVAGMHYLGMSAMLMPATLEYNIALVVASVVIAVVASIAALWLAFNLRGPLQMLGSALVMGIAVCGMHYTGMAAVEFHAMGDQSPVHLEQGMHGDYLGATIFVVVVLLLVVTLGIRLFRHQRRAAVSI